MTTALTSQVQIILSRLSDEDVEKEKIGIMFF